MQILLYEISPGGKQSSSSEIQGANNEDDSRHIHLSVFARAIDDDSDNGDN